MTLWLHHCPPDGGHIARDQSRYPHRGMASWAQAPGGETKASVSFFIDQTVCLGQLPVSSNVLDPCISILTFIWTVLPSGMHLENRIV